MACKIFSWAICDLGPWPGIKPNSPALGLWVLSHWTTRKFPFLILKVPRIMLSRQKSRWRVMGGTLEACKRCWESIAVGCSSPRSQRLKKLKVTVSWPPNMLGAHMGRIDEWLYQSVFLVSSHTYQMLVNLSSDEQWELYLFFTLIFIYVFLAVLSRPCCAWTFFSCGKWQLLFIELHGLLIMVASLVVVRRL